MLATQKVASSGVAVPEMQEFLKAGVQFGHETKRWNPKMSKYIFTSKKGVHIIDVSQTIPMLQKALGFLEQVSRQGSILFVGTKRQVSEIIKQEAIKAGAYFVSYRWAGGLLTNFANIQKSLRKMQKLEEGFEQGFEGRTKYEISKMKAEWSKLNRLYGGIKGMQRLPVCLVIIDPRYEVGAVSEANRLEIPIVAITDTNCDPDVIDYVVPANDDALRSVQLLMGLFRDAILKGNGAQGVRHDLKDYSKVEVKIIKKVKEIETEEQIQTEAQNQPKPRVQQKPSQQTGKFRIKTMQDDGKQKDNLVKKEMKKDEKVDTKTEISKPVEKVQPKKKEVTQKIENEKLSTRTLNSLSKAGVSVKDAKKMKREDLTKIKGLGEKAVDEILS